MTRRENTNNLGQYFVLDIRHTIYGSIIGMSRRVIVKYRVEARIPSLYFDDCFIPLCI